MLRIVRFSEVMISERLKITHIINARHIFVSRPVTQVEDADLSTSLWGASLGMITGKDNSRLTTKQGGTPMKQLAKSAVIVICLFTVTLASDSRVDALGGAKFWADDYANIALFPGSVNDHSLAWTDGSDFNAIWDVDGTKWGFSGSSTANDVINMRWGNGLIGVAFGLNMAGAVDADTAAGIAAAEAATDINIGVGTSLGFGDVGFTYDGSDIGLNLRRDQSLWLFEAMVLGFNMVGESADGADDGYMTVGADLYRMSGGDNANALFALGVGYSNAGDGSFNLNYTWALESTMEWTNLRLGYTQGYDLMNQTGAAGALTAGLGFTYGNWQADLVLSDGTLDGILTNPIYYLHGRNGTALAGAFSLSYAW